MNEDNIAGKLTRVLEELERLGSCGRVRARPSACLSVDAVTDGGATPSYVRLLRVLAFQEILGSAASPAAYRAGEKIGRQIKTDSLDELAGFLRRSGLGVAEVMSRREKGRDSGNIVIRLNGSPVSSGLPLLAEPFCHFEGGLLSGALSRIMKRDMRVTETKCVAMGYEYCQFEAEAQPSPTTLAGETDFTVCSQENIRLITTLAAHVAAALNNVFLYEQARRTTVTDPLTTLFNGEYFRTRLEEEIHRAERNRECFALVVAEVGDYAPNDGHSGLRGGDEMLRGIARAIRECVRCSDLVCRSGDAEFILLLPRADREKARGLIERVRKEAGRYAPESPHLSFCCVRYPDDGRHSEQLLEKARSKLSAARYSVSAE